MLFMRKRWSGDASLLVLLFALPLGCGGSGSGNGQQVGDVENQNKGGNSDHPNGPSDQSDSATCDPNATDGTASGSAHKVVICHYPPGNPANAHTLTVGAPAVDAHLRNHPGDHVGPCGAGEGHCGGQPDAGSEPDGGSGTPDGGPGGQPDGGESCLPMNAACGPGLASCCSLLSCINSICQPQLH